MPSRDELALMAQQAAWLKVEGIVPNVPTPGTPDLVPLGGGALALVLAGIARREDAGTVPVGGPVEVNPVLLSGSGSAEDVARQRCSHQP